MLDQLQSAGTVALDADWPQLAVAAGAAALVLTLLWFARGLARRQHARLARTEATELLEIPLLAASRTTLAFVLVVAVYTGLSVVGLEGRLAEWALRILTIATFWQAGLWASTTAVAWLDHRRKATLVEDKAVAGSIGIIRFVARVLIWGRRSSPRPRRAAGSLHCAR